MVCSNTWWLAMLCLWHGAGALHAGQGAGQAPAQPLSQQNFTALQNDKLDMAREATVIVFQQVLGLHSFCMTVPCLPFGHL